MSGRSSGSGRGSVSSGSQSGSRASSPTPSSGKASGSQKLTGRDPARDKHEPSALELLGKRVDLPADAFKKAADETRFAARPGYSTEGKPIKMQLNIYPVVTWPDTEVYQYDVTVKPNLKESHALVKKVWNTETVTEALAKQGGKWLFDGRSLAWSSKMIDRNEARIAVDLDGLKEKAGHEDIVKKVERQSVYYLTIRQTAVIRLSYLKAYLQGKVSWDTHVLECINFFDHCLRQYPSEKWITIKRNFYDPEFPGGNLGNDLMTNQGIYVAPRLSESINRGGTGLVINVDRCQTAFWPNDRSLDRLALEICTSQKEEWKHWDQHKLQFNLRHKEEQDKKTEQWKFVPSDAFAFLRRMVKLKFTVNHRGKMGRPRIYTIKRLVFDEKHGSEGSNSKNVLFEKTMPDGTKKSISVYDHYKARWGFTLQYWRLPIIETTRGHLFPMELCNIVPDQRYHFKLNPKQTSDMIKMAATRPQKRTADITEGVKYLKWSQDPFLNAFGIKVNPNMVVTDARLLKNPEVTFANGKHDPGVSGRWDLRGKRFLEPNAFPLKSWAVVGCGNDVQSCTQFELENFATQFSQVYRNHGGRVQTAAQVQVIPFTYGDFGKMCEKAYNDLGVWSKSFPQIIFFVISTKNQLVYERIKKNMDCRYNIVSQCLQAGHVKKSNAQYMSNVAMKVNSKLGGVTCKVPGPSQTSAPFWNEPTAMIGVDVSHAAPGSSQPSMAALTMSMDKHATRFAAACETNGWRTETIQATVMHGMLPKLVKHWISINGTNPNHIYYLRDGVSEGQFQAVLDQEVSEMRRVFHELGAHPKFTVIIATKRHHVRFLPKDKKDADRNGNPLPGTLVERDVTHPQHFDFYLCSHVAIQGTARPVHYQVILDDANVKPNDLVKMIYQQCYQYCRSTTPVSLHPAVYYAHLASNRARSHEDVEAHKQIMAYGKPGFPYRQDDSEIYDEPRPLQSPALLPMSSPNKPKDLVRFMNTTMWYV
ncbi:Piwi-domain-containing protein [Hypoxylon sp. FL0543]|nr:Piwi-domain-containing protein [Hypoxylon sp. FL0543]